MGFKERIITGTKRAGAVTVRSLDAIARRWWAPGSLATTGVANGIARLAYTERDAKAEGNRTWVQEQCDDAITGTGMVFAIGLDYGSYALAYEFASSAALRLGQEDYLGAAQALGLGAAMILSRKIAHHGYHRSIVRNINECRSLEKRAAANESVLGEAGCAPQVHRTPDDR